MIGNINNGEQGSSVRGKLNQVIDFVNSGGTDTFITGGTYFTGGTLELTNNLGASIQVTGLTEDLNSEIAGLAEPDEKTITLNLTTNEIELKDVVQAPTGGTRTFEGNIVLQDGDFTTNTGYIDVMNGRTTLGLYDATSSTNEAILRFDNNGSDAYFILSEVTKPSSDITNTLIVGDDGMTGREMFLQVRNSGTGEQSNIGINADKITISTDITSTSSGCNIQVTNDSLAFETLSGDTMIMSAGTFYTNSISATTYQNLPANLTKGSFGITIDGGGSAITTGDKGNIVVPYDCEIVGWTILGDQTGSIVVDLWKDTYANYPPTSGDTITGTEKPTLSSASKNQDNTLTSWTTTVSAGDIIKFNVDSASTVERVQVVINVQKTY